MKKIKRLVIVMIAAIVVLAVFIHYSHCGNAVSFDLPKGEDKNLIAKDRNPKAPTWWLIAFIMYDWPDNDGSIMVSHSGSVLSRVWLSIPSTS